MTDELFFEGQRYISAAEAAGISNLTRDYIARLAREGKIAGRQIARQWYVSDLSLKNFLVAQEYSNSQRRNELVRQRQQEYGRSPGSTVSHEGVQIVSGPSSDQFRSSSSIGKASNVSGSDRTDGSASSAYEALAATDILSEFRPKKLDVQPTFSPFRVLSKIAAGTLAFVLIIGLYTTQGSLAQVSPQLVYDASTSPRLDLTASAAFVGGTFSQLTSAFERGVEALLAPFNGVHLAQNTKTTAVVTVQIAAGRQPGRTTTSAPVSVASTKSTTVQQTIIENPVVERVIESGPSATFAGVTESELDQKIQQLNNALADQIVTSTNANSTVIAQNYNVTAQTNAIDQLYGTTITNPSISGGSISNTDISGGTISGATINGATFTGTTSLQQLEVSGSGTSTYSGGIDLASGCIAVNGTCLGTGGGGAANPGGSDTEVQYNDGGVFNGSSAFTFSAASGTLSVLNASTTNATSTNFFAQAASFTTAFSALFQRPSHR